MRSVGIAGSGTMGAGIAQVAAQSGWDVFLMDATVERAEAGQASVLKRLARLVEKGRITLSESDEIASRIRAVGDMAQLGDCALVVEAITEDLDAKCGLFRALADAVSPSCILATNTSSLSVSALGDACGQASRLAGMHFFNPVALMPLVEVVSGRNTAPHVADTLVDIAQEWGKKPVRVADVPGFIVNRVARGYYLEPMRMLAEGVATVSEMDNILTRLGGFRMGPFELTDLIGNDINAATTRLVWQQLGEPAQLAPSALQAAMVERGDFGRKRKIGWYSYQPEHPVPAVTVERQSFSLTDSLAESVERFVGRAVDEPGNTTENYVLARTLGAVFLEASRLCESKAASASDIDIAMKHGTNYPHGPMEWAERVGRPTCRSLFDALNGSFPDGRFAATEWFSGGATAV